MMGLQMIITLLLNSKINRNNIHIAEEIFNVIKHVHIHIVDVVCTAVNIHI